MPGEKTIDCIYCRENKTAGEEHLIQSALGGRVKSSEIACRDCNNAFSDSRWGKIDDDLAKQMEVPRNLLCVYSGRKNPPPVLKNVGELDGVPFHLAPGGVPVTTTKRQSFVKDGRDHISVHAPTMEKALEQFEHMKRQFGDRLRVENTVQHHQYVPEVSLTVGVGGDESFRAVAKIALNLYGTKYPIECRTPAFDYIRRYIRYGENPQGRHFVGHDHINQFPFAQGDKDFAHTVALVSFAERGPLVGYVRLFGAFQFSVVLCDQYSGVPVNLVLVHGLQSKESRYLTAATALPSSYDASVIESIAFETQREQFKAAMVKILKIHFEMAQDEVTRKIIETSMTEAFPAEGEIITEDHIAKLSRLVAERFVSSVYRIGHEEELSIEDLETK